MKIEEIKKSEYFEDLELVKKSTLIGLIGAAVLGWYLLKPKNVWGEKAIGGYIANVSNPIGTELLENKA